MLEITTVGLGLAKNGQCQNKVLEGRRTVA